MPKEGEADTWAQKSKARMAEQLSSIKGPVQEVGVQYQRKAGRRLTLVHRLQVTEISLDDDRHNGEVDYERLEGFMSQQLDLVR